MKMHAPGTGGAAHPRHAKTPAWQRERGAALVVSLVLLIVTSLLGVSGYQSSLSHERMASNYRESLLALNEAEAGVAAFYQAIQQPAATNFVFADQEAADALQALVATASLATEIIDGAQDENEEAALQEANSQFDAANDAWSPGALNGPLGKYTWKLSAFHPEQVAMNVDPDSHTFWLVSEGRYGQSGREAVRSVKVLVSIPESTSFPFTGIMTCEGVTLAGSGTIDSYDSQLGSYGINGNRHGNKVLVTSQVENMPVTLNGNAPIFGRVEVPGDVIATGSSPIIGDIKANGNVDIRGGDWWYEERQESGRVFGNIQAVGDVIANGTAHGNVESNGRIELNPGSRIQGSATASTIDFPNNSDPDDFVTGGYRELPGGAGVSPVSSVPTSGGCKTLRVDERVDTFADVVSSGSLSLKGDGRDIVLSDSGLHDPNGSPEVTVERMTLDGQEVSVVRFDSFSLGGSARFVVGEPDNPVDMVMVIDGDTDIGGGGSFTISEGSTLQIVTSGQFDLGSGIAVGDEKPSKQVDGKTVPILSIVSNYRDAQSQGNSVGVRIRGSAAFHGQVIAPFSVVDIGGSGGMFGAINARQAEVAGAGGFHYDENFSDLPGFEGDTVLAEPRLNMMVEQVSL
ncbi:PilX N-terminal domain-containing pilus assembly protein [Litchfieldella rifensis]|uniref:PilX N-terminal domain-containing pilus assembly protein n=1 Tax=Litchfieldella rifensis TaxID=762643 RepID=A0ABV7LM15_9GAMM